MNVNVVRSRMTHRTTIEFSSHDDTDRYAIPDVVPVEQDGEPVQYPCWLYTSKDGREPVRPEGTVVVDTLKMLMPLTTDVRSIYRLGTVTDRRGTPIMTGPFDIESVTPHHTHFELSLRRVTGMGQAVPS